MLAEANVIGKRGEYAVIAKLMETGLRVYTPVVDSEGIDCIVNNDKSRLIKIQVKTRRKRESESRHFRVKNLNSDKDYFICCYFIDTDELWTIPSIEFKRTAFTNSEGITILAMTPPKQIQLSKYKDNLGLNLLKLGNFKG